MGVSGHLEVKHRICTMARFIFVYLAMGFLLMSQDSSAFSIKKTFAKAIDVLQPAAISQTRTGEMDGPCPEMSSVCGNLKDWCHKNPAIDHICTTTCNSCYPVISDQQK